MKSVYKKLVSFSDAVDLALSEIRAELDTEIVDLGESEGRILSRNVFSPRDNPPFNRATMDGYAVRSRDVPDASPDHPVTLKITGESFIGEPHRELSGENNCFKISTGAIVPVGSDSVVKVESTEESEGIVRVYESVSPSENIAESGSDIISSELILMAGVEIGTNDIAVLASLGIHQVSVYRKLKVNVISTGNELVGYGEPQFEGQINDANGVAITAELNSYGCIEATYSGIVRDNYRNISDAMNSSLEKNDLIILSGGSSAGEADLVYRIIEEFEPGIIFHGVLVKPGLPTVLGRKGSKAVIGLPGFPVSALMVFRSIFFIPILRAAGSSRIPELTNGRLGINLRLDMGKQNLVPVSISERGKNNVYPVIGLSGSISRFTSTSGFISVPGTTKFLERDSDVTVTLWGSRNTRKNTILSGMLFKSSDEFFRNSLNDVEFHRTLPRDALISVSNGDSDISVFYAESSFDIRSYVKNETHTDNLEIFTGPEIKLTIASEKDFKNVDELLERSGTEEQYSGPALRLLRNLVGANLQVRKLIHFLENHISNYFSSDVNSADSASPGKNLAFTIITGEKAGLRTLPLTSFRPVFVVSGNGKRKLQDLVDPEEITAVR